MEQQTFNMPLLGDDFPELTLQTTHGVLSLPKDMKGSWYVLFSHPADFTPVCTTEFIEFQRLVPEFDKLGVKLVGMSVDQIFSHIKWVQWIKDVMKVDISFPIAAANDAIAARLGMLHPGKGTNTVRAVFVIDPNGKVRLVMYYPQEIGRNMEELVRAIHALQVTDKNGVAAPAAWPKNAIIGDHVIIPPAKTMAEAAERLKKYEGFDWWFCHKAL
jgi:peroxiredoxin (alkyl hydroperoxide reductase subunit C)